MLGQGIMPRQHHPVADPMRDAEPPQFLEGIGRQVNSTVRQLPPQQDDAARCSGRAGREAVEP